MINNILHKTLKLIRLFFDSLSTPFLFSKAVLQLPSWLADQLLWGPSIEKPKTDICLEPPHLSLLATLGPWFLWPVPCYSCQMPTIKESIMSYYNLVPLLIKHCSALAYVCFVHQCMQSWDTNDLTSPSGTTNTDIVWR